MPWLNLDDSLNDNPKFLKLEREFGAALALQAQGLWLRILIHCARNLTDGYVDAVVLPRLTNLRKPRVAALIGAMKHVGMLHERADGWQVHDYLEWNKSREQVLGKREKDRLAAAGKRREIAKVDPKLINNGSHSCTTLKDETEQKQQLREDVAHESRCPTTTTYIDKEDNAARQQVASIPSGALTRRVDALGELTDLTQALAADGIAIMVAPKEEARARKLLPIRSDEYREAVVRAREVGGKMSTGLVLAKIEFLRADKPAGKSNLSHGAKIQQRGLQVLESYLDRKAGDA